MSLQNDLKKYLPEIYQSSKVMNEFLDSIGELLDGFKSNIDAVKDYNDYLNIDEDKLELLAKQYDINFPRNLGISRKRQHVRDAVSLYRSNGSERSLIRTFSLIGWKVTVDNCWIVNPNYYTDVITEYNLTNELGTVVPLNKYDIIFGDSVIYDDGAYVDLYDASNNQFSKRPIYGESYNVYVSNPTFVKVPYIKISITTEDYDLFTADYVDPITSKIYSYTESENFSILSEIREYFLNQARPTHVAIIEISSPFNISDTLIYTIAESETTTTLDAGAAYDGSLTYGVPIDRYILGETYGDFTYFSQASLIDNPDLTFFDNTPSNDTIVRDAGSWLDDGFFAGSKIRVLFTNNNDNIYTLDSVTDSTLTLISSDTLIDEGPINNINIKSYGEMSYYEVFEDAPDVVVTREYAIGSSGLQKYIPTRKSSTLVISVPSDCTLIVYGSTNDRKKIAEGTYNWTILNTLNNVTDYTIEISNKFAIGINITTPSSISAITLTVTHH